MTYDDDLSVNGDPKNRDTSTMFGDDNGKWATNDVSGAMIHDEALTMYQEQWEIDYERLKMTNDRWKNIGARYM